MGRTILVIAAFAVIYFLAASGERRLSEREPKARAEAASVQGTSDAPVAVPVPPPASPAARPTAPEPEPDPEAAPPDFGPERAEGRWLATGPTALRAGPSILYPEIGLLLEGTVVEVTGRQDDWLRIRAQGGLPAYVPAAFFQRVDAAAARP